ncbi:MAG: hypothetical protein NTX45_04895 [Proteobacteria bacterium]|nr:hypothetical protein [Pseudomonadota bacterium]
MKTLNKLPILTLIAGACLLASQAASAASYDWSAAGAHSETINGALFDANYTGPAGSGVIDSFERWQANGGGTAGNISEGYNTNANNVLDNKNGVFTHDLLKSSLTVLSRGATNYYVFGLDIDEPSSAPDSKLSIDELRLFTSNNAGWSGNASSLTAANGFNKVYDLGANNLILNAANAPGSGKFNMLFAVLASIIDASAGDRVTLYTKDGVQFKEQGGFEEWAHIKGANGPYTPPEPGPVPTPIPAAIWMVGSALFGAFGFARRKGKADA